MMRTLIAIATLLASVSASAGELDGKGIACLFPRQTYGTYWYRFDENEVTEFHLKSVEATRSVEGTLVSTEKFEIEEEALGEYEVRPTEIVWAVPIPEEYRTYYGHLDRTTLELQYRDSRNDVVSRSGCSVTDWEGLERSMESSRAHFQNFFDEELNKKIKNRKI